MTKPFSFEGQRRGAVADEGVEELAREVDTLIVIPNARLLSVIEARVSTEKSDVYKDCRVGYEAVRRK